MNESFCFGDQAEAAVVARPKSECGLRLGGRFRVELFDRNGRPKALPEEFHNLIVDSGVNQIPHCGDHRFFLRGPDQRQPDAGCRRHAGLPQRLDRGRRPIASRSGKPGRLVR